MDVSVGQDGAPAFGEPSDDLTDEEFTFAAAMLVGARPKLANRAGDDLSNGDHEELKLQVAPIAPVARQSK